MCVVRRSEISMTFGTRHIFIWFNRPFIHSWHGRDGWRQPSTSRISAIFFSSWRMWIRSWLFQIRMVSGRQPPILWATDIPWFRQIWQKFFFFSFLVDEEISPSACERQRNADRWVVKLETKPQACDGDSGWWTANNFFGIDNQNYLMQLHRWLIQKHDLPMSAFIVCADQNQITIFCARRSDDAINIASTFFSGLFCKDHWSMIYYFLRTICKKANWMGKVQCPKLTVDGWWWAKIIIQRQRGWHNRHKVPKYMY